MENKKKRCFMVQRNYFFDTHDKNGNLVWNITEEEWKSYICANWNLAKLNADTIAFIFHDKDFDENGDVKKLHVHAVVEFKNQRYAQGVADLMGLSSLQNCQGVRSKVDCYRYLTHISEEAINSKKHIYNFNEVIVLDNNNRRYADLIVRSKAKQRRDKKALEQIEFDNVCNELYDDIISGKSLPVDCFNYLRKLDKFDNSMIVSVKKRFDDAYKIRCDCILDLCKKGQYKRNLKLIYIEGISGVGKTSLSKKICLRFSERFYTSSQKMSGITHDLLSNYNLEKSVLFDEVVPANFGSTSNFLQMFNPYEAAEVSSRYHNKIFIADFVCMCNSLPFIKFLYEMYQVDNYELRNSDNIYQMLRRFSCVITLTGNEAELKFIDNKLKYHSFDEVGYNLPVFAFAKNIVHKCTIEYDINNLDTLDKIVDYVFSYFNGDKIDDKK